MLRHRDSRQPINIFFKKKERWREAEKNEEEKENEGKEKDDWLRGKTRQIFCTKHIDAPERDPQRRKEKDARVGGGVPLHTQASTKAGPGRNGFKLGSLQGPLKHTKNHAAFSHLQHGWRLLPPWPDGIKLEVRHQSDRCYSWMTRMTYGFPFGDELFSHFPLQWRQIFKQRLCP